MAISRHSPKAQRSPRRHPVEQDRTQLARRSGFAANDERLVSGRLSVHPRGFGFLRPDDGNADLFIPPPVNDALDGDRVLVVKTDEPRVLGVLERGRRAAAAVWQGRDQATPDDSKLPSKLSVVTGSKRPRRGDAIVVDLTKTPYRIRQIVGRAGADGVDERAALAEADISTEFPPAVLRYVKSLKDEPARRANRLDLRSERAVVTIDPLTSKDFDDAVSLTRVKGGWRLGVHIADVTAWVEPGSCLDMEARKRGTSVYLPSRVIPMLPERLSNDLCSLREGEDRLTKTVILHIREDGTIASQSFHRSIIRPFRRLTYERASRVMEGADGEHPEVASTLRAMHDVAGRLASRRRNAMILERPQAHFTYDGSGRIVAVGEPETDCAHGVIEEFMIAANASVGTWLHRQGEPALWRHHPPPSCLESFIDFTHSLGIPYQPHESVSTYLRKIHGRPELPLIVQELLWALPAAEYRPDRSGHYALDQPHYLHFTSPIRRYADLQVHRAVDRALGQGNPSTEDLEELGRHLSIRERAAASVENRLRHRRILDYLSHKERGPHQAIVTQIQRTGLKVELTRFLVWGALSFKDLPGGRYRRDGLCAQNEHTLFRLGDLLHVTVAHTDTRTGQVVFHLCD